jgi:hypothetical protein
MKHSIPDKEYFRCQCGSELLLLSYDKDDCFSSIDLSMYKAEKSIFHYITSILKNGHPYDDEICLDLEDAKRLRDTLITIIDQKEKEIQEALKTLEKQNDI